MLDRLACTPSATKGFWQACHDLQLDRAAVVAPVSGAYPLRVGAEVIPVWDLADWFQN